MLIVILVTLITIGIILYLGKENKELFIGFIVIVLVVNTLISVLDVKKRTTAREMWSGKVIECFHTDAWDEYVPPKTEIHKSGDSTYTTVTPGYYIHHDAENIIQTSDNGKILVRHSYTGKPYNDDYPSSVSQLEKDWLGKNSVSIHSYKNKIQASNSIYKSNKVDLKKYKDLPDYPTTVNNYIEIDRIVGNVPNKDKALEKLNQCNTYLNKPVKDPEKPNKTKSWKQVNIMFVNLQGKSKDYGYALQDKWKNGNKNDFIIAFNMEKNGDIKWCIPISWTESEKLKLNIRNYMSNLREVKDFTEVVDNVSSMVEKDFNRKEFKDFNYIRIDVSIFSIILISIIDGLIIFLIIKIF